MPCADEEPPVVGYICWTCGLLVAADGPAEIVCLECTALVGGSVPLWPVDTLEPAPADPDDDLPF